MLNCGGVCAQGYLWVPDIKQCVFSEFCPPGFIKTLDSATKVNVCKKPTTGQFAIDTIDQLTLDLASGTHPMTSPAYIAELITTLHPTSQRSLIACTWSIEDISGDKPKPQQLGLGTSQLNAKAQTLTTAAVSTLRA